MPVVTTPLLDMRERESFGHCQPQWSKRVQIVIWWLTVSTSQPSGQVDSCCPSFSLLHMVIRGINLVVVLCLIYEMTSCFKNHSSNCSTSHVYSIECPHHSDHIPIYLVFVLFNPSPLCHTDWACILKCVPAHDSMSHRQHIFWNVF